MLQQQALAAAPRQPNRPNRTRKEKEGRRTPGAGRSISPKNSPSPPPGCAGVRASGRPCVLSCLGHGIEDVSDDRRAAAAAVTPVPENRPLVRFRGALLTRLLSRSVSWLERPFGPASARNTRRRGCVPLSSAPVGVARLSRRRTDAGCGFRLRAPFLTRTPDEGTTPRGRLQPKSHRSVAWSSQRDMRAQRRRYNDRSVHAAVASRAARSPTCPPAFNRTSEITSKWGGSSGAASTAWCTKWWTRRRARSLRASRLPRTGSRPRPTSSSSARRS